MTPTGQVLEVVYPRMYGETVNQKIDRLQQTGLSPHVRGNPTSTRSIPSRRGSIPACTGKPHGYEVVIVMCWVYPRMYGETVHCKLREDGYEGLSPHVRGNRRFYCLRTTGLRSIPACTGKPEHWVSGSAGRQVYPRMYGETPRSVLPLVALKGLSPHVRGNRAHQDQHPRGNGSIPACTGKPRTDRGRSPGPKVYPRMYGETRRAAARASDAGGLSPHVRGNPGMRRQLGPAARSIPACTGKPSSRRCRAGWPRVYPRMYGETAGQEGRPGGQVGLSPHVRGNPDARAVHQHQDGSIPACTGKPRWAMGGGFRPRVYPRMYGETDIKEELARQARGLSPHVRGNLE